MNSSNILPLPNALFLLHMRNMIEPYLQQLSIEIP